MKCFVSIIFRAGLSVHTTPHHGLQSTASTIHGQVVDHNRCRRDHEIPNRWRPSNEQIRTAIRGAATCAVHHKRRTARCWGHCCCCGISWPSLCRLPQANHRTVFAEGTGPVLARGLPAMWMLWLSAGRSGRHHVFAGESNFMQTRLFTVSADGLAVNGIWWLRMMPICVCVYVEIALGCLEALDVVRRAAKWFRRSRWSCGPRVMCITWIALRVNSADTGIHLTSHR